jgi:DNA-binding transcriptional regulator YiaG
MGIQNPKENTKAMNTKPFYERLIGISAKEIAARIGCPIQTVYDWKSGRRSPPSWIQGIIMEIMEGRNEKP